MDKKERLSQIVEQYPPLLSPEEQNQKALELIRLRQEIEQNVSGREKIIVMIPDQDPIMFVALNDTHMGAVSTDYDAIEEMKDFALNNDNVFVIGVGDYVEGIKGEYLSTNVTRTPIDLQQQIELVKYYLLQPLAEQGKILAMVSDYWGHDGWAWDATTINPWKVLTEGLDIPLLRNNGSILEIQLADGQVVTWETYHAPPGKSRNDPVHGLRVAALSTSESNRADVFVAGHTHQMGVAKEQYAGSKKSTTFIQSGTPKGSADHIVPDPFGVRISRKKADAAGQGVVVKSQGENRRPLILPYPSLRHGEVINDMTEYLNTLERQGLTREVYERIRAEVEARPDIRFNRAASSVVLEPHDETPKEKTNGKEAEDDVPPVSYKLAQQFDSLGFHIVSSLPKILTPISRVRLGSASEGGKELNRFLKEYGTNPDFLFVYLSDILDKDVPGSHNREDTLKRYVKAINQTNGNTLAIMFDGILRNNKWKSPIGKYGSGLPAATYLADTTGVRLIANQANISIALGPDSVRMMDKPVYTGVMADHLRGHGSQSKPTFGLQQLYAQHIHEKPGFVMGGHMPNSGYDISEDDTNAETDYPVFVAPGGFAKQDATTGKSNVSRVAEYGQAVILMPGVTKDDYMVLAVANKTDLAYLAPASVLYVGSNILGITDSILGR